MTERHVAIVTGAGSGIGRDTAILLAEVGFGLTLVGRSQEKLDATKEQIVGRHPVDCLLISADLADSEASRAVVRRTVEHFGRLDAIANVAGRADLGPIEKLDDQTVRASLGVNLESVVHLTAAAWPVFRKQKGGVIVNVSSMASVDPFPGFGIYAPAKAAVNMFTKCTAAEGAKMGLKAVAVAPGAVETPMLRGMFNTKMIPEDKTLDPVEVAAVIRDCILGTREFESGSVITMPTG